MNRGSIGIDSGIGLRFDRGRTPTQGGGAAWAPTWQSSPGSSAELEKGIIGRSYSNGTTRHLLKRRQASIVLIVNGTACSVKMGNWNSNTGTAMLEYTVDNGGVQTKAWGTVGSAIELFSGLTDGEHIVTLRGTGAFTDGVYVSLGQSDAITVTGSDPKWRVAQYTYAAGDGNIDTGAGLTADAGNYEPQYQVYNGNGLTSSMTAFDVGAGGGELFVSTHDDGKVLVSFDGDAPQVVDDGHYGGHILIPEGTSRVWVWSEPKNSGGFYNYLSFGTDVEPTFPSMPCIYHFGHSIVYGSEATYASAGTDMPRTAIANGYICEVAGDAGATVTDILANMTAALAKYTVNSDDVIIIDAGRNDSPTSAMDGTEAADYEDCIDLAVATGCAKVLCMGVMELNGEDFSPWNDDIASIVSGHAASNVFFVDRSGYNNGTVSTADFTHPDDDGYTAMVALNNAGWAATYL